MGFWLGQDVVGGLISNSNIVIKYKLQLCIGFWYQESHYGGSQSYFGVLELLQWNNFGG